MSYFLGIDVGTSSVKSLLVDEAGTIVDIASREYDIEKPSSLFAQQDMRVLWEKTCETIAQITGRDKTAAEKIAGIGFSGQMHGLVMLGEDGELLDSAIIWADQRSSDQVRQIYDLIGEQAYKEITLNDLSSGFTLSSLQWVKQCRPMVYEKIRTILLPKDYIRYRMCKEPGTDCSDASASLMFDVRKEKWAFSVADRLGFDRDMFPDCHESHETAGVVSPECAALTGLKKGTPVMFGGGDSIMQQLGNGLVFLPYMNGSRCPVNDPNA